MRETPHFGDQDCIRVVIEAGWVAESAQSQPEMIEGDFVDVQAEITKRVDVAVANTPPIAKLDAELECGFGRLHETRLADVQRIVETPDVRERCLANANRADLVGLDELNRERQA